MNENYSAFVRRWRVRVGFLLAVAYFAFAQPRWNLIIVGSAIAFPGLCIRAYAAGCLRKNKALALGGPYAKTRNPLYLGSVVMAVGFAVASGVWYLGAAMLGVFLLIYWPVMRREEAFLLNEFGEAYTQYAAKVPFFFPALTNPSLGGAPFQWSQYVKNREYQAALGFCGGIGFLVAKMLWWK